jgi:hypothetical protein
MHDRYGFQGRDMPPARNPRILCLGVRSGAEVDMFRAVFYGPLLRFSKVQEYARKADTSAIGEPKIRLARRLGVGGGSGHDGRVIGVEINPDAKRDDVWIGSFDDLPSDWESRFDLIYSNSIDHAQDPQRTIAEWKRVAAPGAYVILGFTEGTAVSSHDPFGDIDFKVMQELWQAPIVFLSSTMNQNGYKEICFRINLN